MGLLDGLQPGTRKQSCKIQNIANDLEPDDREIFWAAINNHDWAPHGLARQLTERGVSVTRETIARHRGNTCSCSKA